MGKGASAGHPNSRSLPKAPTGIEGLDEITGGGLPARAAHARLRRRRLRQDAARDGVPGPRRDASSASPASSWRSRRPPRSWRRTSARSGSTWRSWSSRRSCWWTTSGSSAARSRRPATTTSKACSSASATPSTRSGAKRVVLDTIEALFGGLSNAAILRAELRRLFRWLKEQGRHGDHHRRARRGHADPPRPGGVRLRLRHPPRPPRHRAALDAAPAHRQVPRHDARHQRVSVPDRRDGHLRPADHVARPAATRRRNERISTGIPRLDAMLGGKGVYRGSSVLVSGTAGTGKTSLAAHFADAACRRGERCLYFAFEESESQLDAQHAIDRPGPGALVEAGTCCGSTPRARPLTVWRCTSPRSTS